MKSVLLIRHAKSDWDSAALKDFDRPLNKRGKRDAPEMASRLKEKKVNIDALVSSPALRALSTCKLFAKELNYKEKDIILRPELYEAHESIFYDVIKKASNSFDSIAIFAHNPGITAFVNELTHTQIDNMPTCSVFAVRSRIKDWKDFSDAENEFWFFDFPKKDA